MLHFFPALPLGLGAWVLRRCPVVSAIRASSKRERVLPRPCRNDNGWLIFVLSIEGLDRSIHSRYCARKRSIHRNHESVKSAKDVAPWLSDLPQHKRRARPLRRSS